MWKGQRVTGKQVQSGAGTKAASGATPLGAMAHALGSALPRVHLASRSPRRRELLTQAGIEHDASHPGVDDGQLEPGNVDPQQWVMALAYLKAATALRSLVAGDGPVGVGPRVVIGADTVVVCSSGQVMSAPVNEADARQMLHAMRNAAHDVITGVAIIDRLSGHRQLFSDRAHVRVGHISDADLDAYLASGQWQGKAGGYNLSERLAAGWPIEFSGDPNTIMGLPVRLLIERLHQLSVAKATDDA